MNRLLLSIYDQLYLRLIRPLLNFLIYWLIEPFNILKQDWLVLIRRPLYISRRHFYGKIAVAIGMLMAGWLGATGVQAQTCGTHRFTTTQFASAANVATRTGTSGLCVPFVLPCNINNVSRVTDTDLTNAASIQLGGIGAEGSISTSISSATMAAGATAGYVVNTGILNLGVGQTIQITTYLNGVQQNQGTVGALIDLPILGSGTTFLGIPTTKPFNEIQITM